MNAPFAAASSGARTGHVLAWDAPTRLFKWALALLVLGGWASNAFGGAYPAWHRWNGYAALVLIVFRVLWGFAGGSTARFSGFVAGPRQSIAYGLSLLRGRSARYLGHNPLGGWMVLALLAAVGLQATTGLLSADADRLIIEEPLAGRVAEATVIFFSRWHHRLFDALEILIVLHVVANIFYAVVKRDPLIRAMIGGEKPAEDYVDQSGATPGGWGAAALCLAISATLVFGTIYLAGGRNF